MRWILLYQFERLYDELAPPKKVQVHVRKRIPWFTPDIIAQKKIVRNRETVWLSDQEQHHWKAFKRERNRYRHMLNYSRSQCIKGSILEVRGDTKKLYQVISELTDSVKVEQWPEHTSKEQLANLFADFFLDKIVNIRKMLEGFNKLEIDKDHSIPLFTKFGTMSEKEIRKLVMSMKTKSCELDPIQTKIIKDNIEHFLPVYRIHIFIRTGSVPLWGHY